MIVQAFDSKDGSLAAVFVAFGDADMTRCAVALASPLDDLHSTMATTSPRGIPADDNTLDTALPVADDLARPLAAHNTPLADQEMNSPTSIVVEYALGAEDRDDVTGHTPLVERWSPSTAAQMTTSLYLLQTPATVSHEVDQETLSIPVRLVSMSFAFPDCRSGAWTSHLKTTNASSALTAARAQFVRHVQLQDDADMVQAVMESAVVRTATSAAPTRRLLQTSTVGHVSSHLGDDSVASHRVARGSSNEVSHTTFYVD